MHNWDLVQIHSGNIGYMKRPDKLPCGGILLEDIFFFPIYVFGY